MSTFSLTALPLLATGVVFVTLFFRKKDKNYLIPAVVFLASGLVNFVIGITAD